MSEPKQFKDVWDFFDEADQRRRSRSWYRKGWDWSVRMLDHLWIYYLSPRALWSTLKFFYQRRRRGFDDRELWNLDHTILEFVLPRLKRYWAVERMGWPGPEQIFDISYEEFEKLAEAEQDDLIQRSLEEWNRMIGKMIRAIELFLEHDGTFIKPNPEWKEGDSRRYKYLADHDAEAEYQEGWKLFHDWFHALWD